MSGIKLGKIWGIPIRLHLSWFLIIGMVTWSLARGYFPQEYPNMPAAFYWILGVITGLLFAASVLLHELGHSYMALRDKVEVREVTLYLFGGVAQITQEPKSAASEFRISIAGPAVSLVLAGFFYLLWMLDRTIPYLAAPSAWLGRINLLLGLFNMIPAFPLDGGRVLRALVWKISNNQKTANMVASLSGQIAAVGFIGVGIFTIFYNGNFFNGAWLVFIGWFMQNATNASISQSTVHQSLRGVKVAQVMEDCDMVFLPWNMSLDRIVEEHVLNGAHRAFLVTDTNGASLRGLLSLQEITAVPRPAWGATIAEEVMIPRSKLSILSPDAELLDALQRMDDARLAELPVMDGATIRGILTREQILHYLRVRAEVGV